VSGVRVAGPQDAALVASLLIAFRDHMGYSTPPDESFHATVAMLIEDPKCVYLLADDLGVAQLRFRLSVWTGVEDCWLEDLFVSEDARGQGLGRALLEECFAVARSRGCKRIELDVQADNTGALRLYESAGFSATPKGPVQTLFMSRRL
jgi:ribosomal protein S18 acetylase RimI-like enzyme